MQANIKNIINNKKDDNDCSLFSEKEKKII